MYRFRKISNLLGEYQELEEQEIYFSDLSALNDPMEGFRDFYWCGDIIVWRNLFKHYLLCLEYMCTLASLSDDQLFSPKDIPIYYVETNLPTEEYKMMFKEICNKFFNNEGVSEFIGILPNVRISRDELLVHLISLHLIAFYSIMEVHVVHKLQPEPTQPFLDYSDNLKKFVKMWKELNLENEESQDKIKIIFEIEKDFMLQFDLISAYKLNGTPADQRKCFILSQFPNAYISMIEKLTYPEAYVACFMKDCTNASVWGHYAEGHKGVCLKFKTKEINGLPSINLNCITSWSFARGQEMKPTYSIRPFTFREIEYSNNFISVDFFRSIGRPPAGQLMKQWYTDHEGNISQYASHMKDSKSEEEWRNNYWNVFENSLFTKLIDWEYEQEQRLILHSSLDSFTKSENRKLKYKFEDLEAIIFGARTATEDKIKIIKIIESKCKENNRKDFDFYQADYSQLSGSMKISKLNFIKVNQ